MDRVHDIENEKKPLALLVASICLFVWAETSGRSRDTKFPRSRLYVQLLSGPRILSNKRRFCGKLRRTQVS